MKFAGISFNIEFASFHFCSCDVISPSFAYQDGGLHVTSFSTLNANILRNRRDIEKRSTVFFPILSEVHGVLFDFTLEVFRLVTPEGSLLYLYKGVCV